MSRLITKNAIGAVIAVSLLIVVTVFAVISFQMWFNTYSNKIYVDVNQNSKFNLNSKILTLVGNQVYFDNGLNENITITQIKVGNQTCELNNLTLKAGINNISLGECLTGIKDSSYDVVIVTDNAIYGKKVFLKDGTINPLTNQEDLIEPSFPIKFISPTPENNSILSSDNFYVNLSFDTNKNISSIIDFDNLLIGWWRMDNYNLNYVYDEFGKHNCSIKNSTSYTSNGALGGSFNFSGSKYLDCGTIVMSGSQGTISAWVYANSFQTVSPYISTVAGEETYSSKFMLRIGDTSIDNNQLQFVLKIGGIEYKVSSNTGLDTNKWYNIVATYDGTKMAIYINGVLDNSVSQSGIFTANTPFTIGSSYGSRYFDGLIDDVMILKRGLSPEEVSNLYYHQNNFFGYNYTNLIYVDYTIKAYSQNIDGDVSQTEERNIVIS